MSTNTANLSGNYEPSATSTRDYSDIIQLDRPIIKGHPAMSRASRAAQFMPFAALTTYNEVVAEVEEENTFSGNVIIPDDDVTDFEEDTNLSIDNLETQPTE